MSFNFGALAGKKNGGKRRKRSTQNRYIEEMRDDAGFLPDEGGILGALGSQLSGDLEASINGIRTPKATEKQHIPRKAKAAQERVTANLQQRQHEENKQQRGSYPRSSRRSSSSARCGALARADQANRREMQDRRHSSGPPQKSTSIQLNKFHEKCRQAGGKQSMLLGAGSMVTKRSKESSRDAVPTEPPPPWVQPQTHFTAPSDDDSEVEVVGAPQDASFKAEERRYKKAQMDKRLPENSRTTKETPESGGTCAQTAWEVHDDDLAQVHDDDSVIAQSSNASTFSAAHGARPPPSGDNLKTKHPYKAMTHVAMDALSSNEKELILRGKPDVDFFDQEYSTPPSPPLELSIVDRDCGMPLSPTLQSSAVHRDSSESQSATSQSSATERDSGAFQSATSQSRTPPAPSLAITKRNGKKKPSFFPLIGKKKSKESTPIIPGNSLKSNPVESDPIENDFSSQSSLSDKYIGRKRKQGSDTEDEEWKDENSFSVNGRRKQKAYGKKPAAKKRRSSGVDAASFHSKISQNPKRSTLRSSAKKPQAQTQNQIQINLCSDSDSESKNTEFASGVDLTSPMASQSPPPRRLTRSVSREVAAVRIAIGTKVFHSDCRVCFDSGRESTGAQQCKSMKISYRPSDEDNTKRTSKKAAHVDLLINLDGNSIEEVKYYLVGDDSDPSCEQTLSRKRYDREDSRVSSFDESDQMSFFAMRVKPDKENGLDSMPKFYVQSPTRRKPEMNYIVIELRSDKQLQEILKTFKADRDLAPFVDESARLELKEVPKFAAAFIEESKEEKRRREKSLGSSRATRKKSAKRDADNGDELLLVYPFGGSAEALDHAAQGLVEASGVTFRNEEGRTLGSERRPEGSQLCDGIQQTESSEDDAPDGAASGGDGKSKFRTHALTIRSEDRARLTPGEFLNDTLIDFWMQWIWRKDKEIMGVKSRVHFFTSHFYTALKDEGPAGVTSWTRKKGINVFKKMFIFIPINKSLHWSLCVVVNPSQIRVKDADLTEEEVPDYKSCPCILFLDSLKAHKKTVVAKAVRGWLNSEWSRLGYGKASDNPFTPKAMPVYDPKIPYQDNSWDCGVFVCRYAYSMYLLRDQEFTFRDERQRNPFHDAITKSPEFHFGMDDIRRLRKEIGILVDRLSTLYQEKVKEEKEERKAKKAEEKARIAAEKKTKEQCEEKQSQDDPKDGEERGGNCLRSPTDDKMNFCDI